MKLIFTPICSGVRGNVKFEDSEGMFDNYSHALFCTHHLNRKSFYKYFLPCNFLYLTKSGNAKVEVLSRNGKLYTRYVSRNRIMIKKGGEQ